MGTRSLTIIKDTQQEIAVIYQQFDGYPEGVGNDLKGMLADARIVNGISLRDDSSNTHNDMNCLAATLVKLRKEGIGNVYLYPAGTRDVGEEYRYTLFPSEEPQTFSGRHAAHLMLKVESGYGKEWRTIYEGALADFDPKAANAKDEE